MYSAVSEKEYTQSVAVAIHISFYRCLTSLDLSTPNRGKRNAGTNAAAPSGTASDTQYTAVTIST